MTDTRIELERIAVLVGAAQEKALRAQALARDGQGERAEFFAGAAAKASADALHRLTLHGGRLPELSPPVEDLPDLAALVRLPPDAEALAAGLRALLPVAERIDAARGRALDESIAGSRGLDLAEDLVQLLARIELDIYGPAAPVTGARE